MDLHELLRLILWIAGGLVLLLAIALGALYVGAKMMSDSPSGDFNSLPKAAKILLLPLIPVALLIILGYECYQRMKRRRRGRRG